MSRDISDSEGYQRNSLILYYYTRSVGDRVSANYGKSCCKKIVTCWYLLSVSASVIANKVQTRSNSEKRKT